MHKPSAKQVTIIIHYYTIILCAAIIVLIVCLSYVTKVSQLS